MSTKVATPKHVSTKKKISQEGYNRLVSERDKLTADLVEVRKQTTELFASERNINEVSYASLRSEEDRITCRLKEVKDILSKVEIENEPTDKNLVGYGNQVTIEMLYKDGDFAGEEETNTYTIVSVSPNPLKGEITPNSIVGKAIYGKKVGDIISTVLGTGDKVEIRIISKI